MVWIVGIYGEQRTRSMLEPSCKTWWQRRGYFIAPLPVLINLRTAFVWEDKFDHRCTNGAISVSTGIRQQSHVIADLFSLDA